MPTKIGAEFDRAVRVLRRIAPPFSLRVVDALTDSDGNEASAALEPNKKNGRWIVLLDSAFATPTNPKAKNILIESAIESLMHELAHALCTEKTGYYGNCNEDWHRSDWGRYYAQIYRTFFEELS